MDNIEQGTVQCPECDSENTVVSINDELRKYHLLEWMCLDCETEFVTGWDILLPIRPDILENIAKYEDEIKAYIAEHKGENGENLCL